MQIFTETLSCHFALSFPLHTVYHIPFPPTSLKCATSCHRDHKQSFHSEIVKPVAALAADDTRVE